MSNLAVERWLRAVNEQWFANARAGSTPVSDRGFMCHRDSAGDNSWGLTLPINEGHLRSITEQLQTDPLRSILERWPEQAAGTSLRIILFVPHTERLVLFWSYFAPAGTVCEGRLNVTVPAPLNRA